MTSQNTFYRPLCLGTLVFAVSVSICARYGLDGHLGRDAAIYMYSGQQMSDGVPPYQSIFDVKGPIGPMIVGVATSLAGLLSVDDIYLTRIVFAAMGCLSTVVMYFLGRNLFRSEAVGLLSAMTFLAFSKFWHCALYSPCPKVAVILFVLLSLLATVHRRWFWAGMAGTAAALTWQPTAVFLIATLVTATAAFPNNRIRNMLWIIMGTLVTAVPICAYFAWKGAFGLLIEQAVIHPFFTTRDATDSLADRLLRIYQSLVMGYQAMFVPIVISLGLVVAGYAWRINRSGSLPAALLHDRFAPLLLTFPAAVIWTILDFQGPADAFIFLPYVSLAFALFIATATDAVGKAVWPRQEQATAMAIKIWLGCALYLVAVNSTFDLRDLPRQRNTVDSINKHIGPDSTVFSLGRPEFFVLSKRKQIDSYGRLTPWVGDYIERNHPGGFAGWLDSIKRQEPDFVIVGKRTDDRYTAQVVQWLKMNYKPTGPPQLAIYVKKRRLPKE